MYFFLKNYIIFINRYPLTNLLIAFILSRSLVSVKLDKPIKTRLKAVTHLRLLNAAERVCNTLIEVPCAVAFKFEATCFLLGNQAFVDVVNPLELVSCQVVE